MTGLTQHAEIAIAIVVQYNSKVCMRSFISTHTILRNEHGAFVSLLDPPEAYIRRSPQSARTVEPSSAAPVEQNQLDCIQARFVAARLQEIRLHALIQLLLLDGVGRGRTRFDKRACVSPVEVPLIDDCRFAHDPLAGGET